MPPEQDDITPNDASTRARQNKITKLRREILSSDSPWPRFPGKVVYLVGAGFSAPLGFPVMRGFLSRGIHLLKMRAWNDSKDPEPSELHRLIVGVEKLLHKYLPLFGSAGRDEPSLEDLFCVVDLFSSRKKSNGHGTRSDRQVLCSFVSAVCDSAWKHHKERLEHVLQHQEPDTCVPTVGQVYFHHGGRLGAAAKTVNKAKSEVCAYRAFLSQIICHQIVAPGEVKALMPDLARSAIISMNYDEIIEEKAGDFAPHLKIFYGNNVVVPDCALCSESAGEQNLSLSPLPKDSEKILPLIKLHGSLNWHFLKKKKGRVHVHQPIPSGSMTGSADANCAEGQCQIYPTWQRNALEETVFDTLLAEARLHLRLATRIVIIGYSLPETDRYINYLLAAAVSTPELPEVEICNPSAIPDLQSRAEVIFGPRLRPEKLTIRPGLLNRICAHQEPQSLHPSVH